MTWARGTVKERRNFKRGVAARAEKPYTVLLKSWALGSECLSSNSAGKESACSAEDLGSIAGLGRSPGEGNGYPLQYSGLDNSVDCLVHGVAKSQTQLNDFHFQ